MRVLGIDPGLTRCGLGVVEGSVGRPLTHGRGRRRAHRRRPARRGAAAARRRRASRRGSSGTRPDVVAVERVFSQHNVRTVMGTAQVSGVALVAAARRGIPVALHTPSEVKAAVTGSGRADKAQVGAMVTRLLRLPERADAGRRRRRAGAGDLPHLAGRRPGAHRGRRCGGGRETVGDRVRAGHRRPGGARARPSSTSAGSGWSCNCTPGTLATLREGGTGHAADQHGGAGGLADGLRLPRRGREVGLRDAADRQRRRPQARPGDARGARPRRPAPRGHPRGRRGR